MTTPAISEDIILTVPAKWTAHYCDGSTEVLTQYDTVGSRAQKERPQSSTNGYICPGTRAMAPFYNYGRKKVWMSSTTDLFAECPSGSESPEVVLQWQNRVFAYESLPAWPEYDETLVQRAEVEALGKLKTGSLNLAQAFAERKQTARTVTNAATEIVASVFEVMRSVRSRDRKRFWDACKRGGRQVPQQWLAVQYGWNPLLADVDNASRALSGLDEMYPNRYILQVTGKAKKAYAREELMHDQNESTYFVKPVRVSGEQGCKVVLQYSLIESLAHTIPYKSLGLTNPVSLAWELVPFSFVLDWILPVGSWLNTFDANLGLTFQQGCRSVLIRYREEEGPLRWDSGDDDSIQGRVLGSIPGSASLYDFYRALYFSSPIPAFPSFKDPFSLKHMASSLSLLTQVFSSSTPPIR